MSRSTDAQVREDLVARFARAKGYTIRQARRLTRRIPTPALIDLVEFAEPVHGRRYGQTSTPRGLIR